MAIEAPLGSIVAWHQKGGDGRHFNIDVAAGSHVHTVTGGDDETRPKNMLHGPFLKKRENRDAISGTG